MWCCGTNIEQGYDMEMLKRISCLVFKENNYVEPPLYNFKSNMAL